MGISQYNDQRWYGLSIRIRDSDVGHEANLAFMVGSNSRKYWISRCPRVGSDKANLRSHVERANLEF